MVTVILSFTGESLLLVLALDHDSLALLVGVGWGGVVSEEFGGLLYGDTRLHTDAVSHHESHPKLCGRVRLADVDDARAPKERHLVRRQTVETERRRTRHERGRLRRKELRVTRGRRGRRRRWIRLRCCGRRGRGRSFGRRS